MAAKLDWDTLVKNVKLAITYYDEPIYADTKSLSLEFALKVLYEYGPQTKGNKNFKWDSILQPTYDPTNKMVITVARFTSEPPTWDSNMLIISLEHAQLLAFFAIKRFNEYSKPENLRLIPTAAAVVSKTKLPKMAQVTGMELTTLIDALNASSLFGGHYLVDSDLALAFLFKMYALRVIANNDYNKVKIIMNTVNSYQEYGKTYNKALYDAVSPYFTKRLKSFYNFLEIKEIMACGPGMVPPGSLLAITRYRYD